ncbi:hypothetical protein, partial [uncultured Mobiluncus sp.]|uniref:hypothetical protein n=1 Tax=uncultured Mobiluncus sp. TaxID=293425 RepID=UPI0026272C7B
EILRCLVGSEMCIRDRPEPAILRKFAGYAGGTHWYVLTMSQARWVALGLSQAGWLQRGGCAWAGDITSNALP